MLMSPMRDGRTTSKDSATQLLICELLSFAIFFRISVNFQNSSGTTVTVTLAVTVKTFSLENVAKMK